MPDPGRAIHLDRRPSPLRRACWWLLGAALGAAWLAWATLDRADANTPAPALDRPAAQSAAPTVAGASAPAPFSAEGERARQAQHALWLRRLELAQDTLESYRRATRYPGFSQPMARHADQAYPDRPIEEEHLLSDGKDGNRVSLRTSQERIFVQGDESVRFTVSARDGAGQVVPLRIVRASARELTAPGSGSLYPVVPLAFNDEGSQGDDAAGDGTFSVRLQPRTDGFAGLFGQIRVDAVLQVRGEHGETYFDILYTSEPPAVWQGGVREALEDGSLNFYLKAAVKEAGRYVVHGRVDDANGVPVALVSFNEEVPQGAQEFRLTMFGALIRDEKPAFPLVLRDVDAFLLRPDTFPDRSMMSRRSGKVHASQDYALDSFSAAEWNGEERARYLAELGKDVASAKAQVDRLAR